VTAPPTILIVDDAPMNRVLVRGVLAPEGFRILEAEDGIEARRLSRTASPDLILLDVAMPGESGFETCAHLKSDPATADIPVIFVSALDDVDSKVQGLRLGGVDFIAKPFYGEEVLARVRVHLRIRENNRAAVQEQRARLEQVRHAQQAILTRPEDYPQAHFAVCYRPLEEAGGDFYDVVPIGSDVFGYFVSDVSGHGVSASFLTAALKALLRNYSGPLFSHEDTLRGIDSVIREVLEGDQYVTACSARLNHRTRRLSVIGAGHPPMILLRRGEPAETVELASNPLGVFSSVVLQRRDLTLAPADRFFLYSDGLIEAEPGGGRDAGLKALMEVCEAHRRRPLAEAVNEAVNDLRPEGTPLTDDLLLLGVEVAE
jgi:phosphoserine phosphatase RsbU/P